MEMSSAWRYTASSSCNSFRASRRMDVKRQVMNSCSKMCWAELLGATFGLLDQFAGSECLTLAIPTTNGWKWHDDLWTRSLPSSTCFNVSTVKPACGHLRLLAKLLIAALQAVLGSGFCSATAVESLCGSCKPKTNPSTSIKQLTNKCKCPKHKNRIRKCQDVKVSFQCLGKCGKTCRQLVMCTACCEESEREGGRERETQRRREIEKDIKKERIKERNKEILDIHNSTKQLSRTSPRVPL